MYLSGFWSTNGPHFTSCFLTFKLKTSTFLFNFSIVLSSSHLCSFTFYFKCFWSDKSFIFANQKQIPMYQIAWLVQFVPRTVTLAHDRKYVYVFRLLEKSLPHFYLSVQISIVGTVVRSSDEKLKYWRSLIIKLQNYAVFILYRVTTYD